MRALIDGDIIVFRAAFACEKRVYTLSWQSGATARAQMFESRKALNSFVEEHGLEDYTIESVRNLEPLEFATHNMRSILHGITDALRTDYVSVYLTGTNNFRRALTPSYKANRDPTMRPAWFAECRNWLVGNWGAQVVDGMEADDAIGINTAPDTVCVSIDKDLLTIPGLHYHFVNQDQRIVTPEEAVTNFWKQMLIGDKADNVQGIPKIGPVTANKLLQGKPEAEQYKQVRQLYRKHKLDFDLNYNLLRILRSEAEYERVTQAVRQGQIPAPDLRHLTGAV